MRITKIEDTVSNGEGVRVIVWTQGCLHCCASCHNQQTWDPNGGYEFTDEIKEDLFHQLSRPYIKGLTLSGGDPLHPQNRWGVLELCQQIKEQFPHKTIWLYSGFTYEQIQGFIPDLLPYLDVLVDGKFEIDKYSPALNWRGSSNQRVIDIPKTRQKGEIILFCE